MNMRNLFFVAFLLAAATLFAQTTPIQFDNLKHNFGAINQNDKAEHTFRFTNTSSQAVTLKNVRASCGCTTPAWTREEVKPGATGEIQVSYNTARVGAFNKTVTVTYDSLATPLILTIEGNVLQSPDQVSFQFPQGNLSFEQSSLSTGVLDSDKEQVLTLRFKNIGPKEIRFTGAMEKENMFDVTLKNQVLTPGQIGSLEVKVKGKDFVSGGAFSKNIKLVTDDEAQPDKLFAINGTLNKIYTAEELARMPNIKFEAAEYNAGKVFEGEKVVYAFKFTNTGKEDLVLESVKASCGCTATEPKDKIVKGGASSEILATFDSRGRQGIQNKTITVRSNDPDQGTIILKMNVEVERDPFHAGDVGPGTGSSGN